MDKLPTKTTNGLHPAVEEFVRGVSSTYHDYDEMIEANADLTNRLVVAEGMITHLRAMLAEVTDDRDYYMRHSFALSTGINSAQNVLNGVFDLAKQQATPPARLPEAAQLKVTKEPV